jgi:hypothetical protein
MRSLRLARIAADAELLLLRRRVEMARKRAIFAGVAAVFGIALLVLLHVLADLALQQYGHLSPVIAVLIVGGVDLVLTLLFGFLASGEMADPIADEARQLRDSSIAQMKSGLAATAMLVPAGRLLGKKQLYALVLAGLTARFFRSR